MIRAIDDVKPRAPVAAVFLLLFGIAAVIFGWRFNVYRAVPLEVQIREGVISSSFTVDADAKYELRLQLNRSKLSEDTLVAAAEATPDSPLFIDCDWQLLRNGATFRGGSSRDMPPLTFDSITVGRILGTFPAQPGISYTIRLNTHHVPTTLTVSRPTISAVVTPFYAENRTASSVVAILLGTMLIIISFVFIAREGAAYVKWRFRLGEGAASRS
jgi:membrane protein YdbS with pleckstrin-like domain